MSHPFSRLAIALVCLFTISACATDDGTGSTSTSGGGSLAAFCAGPAGSTGCCVGSTLVWCENNQAIAIECAANQCGFWTPGGFYDCYAYDEGPNRDCPASDGTVCQPTCNGRCGVSDGCGGTCGCPNSQTCQGTICVKGSSPAPCERLMHIGCCDGATRQYCQDSEERSESCSDGCGWNPSGWYDCGFSGEDPTGVWPLACSGS